MYFFKKASEIGTKRVQIVPISMIFQQDGVIVHEDSEAGLQMVLKGLAREESR